MARCNVITQKIRKQLLKIGGALETKHTAVLMLGNGSFAVESVLTTSLSYKDKLLIVSNGISGERIIEMAEYMGVRHTAIRYSFNERIKEEDILYQLEKNKDITHVAIVHKEIGRNIVNPIEDLSRIVKNQGKTLIVDAINSFGYIDINIDKLDIDFLVSSENKRIKGVLGCAFVIVKEKQLLKCKYNSRSLCFDLFEQWKVMNDNGKWRYNTPTNVIVAYSKALDQYIGGENRINNDVSK